jgi:hypothetical protein
MDRDEFDAFVADFRAHIKDLEFDPEDIAMWTDAQKAWMLEHLEMLLEAARDLTARIDAEVSRREAR